MPKSLEQLRRDIDTVDEKIIGLVGKRQALAQRIADVKSEKGKPVRDARRETALLKKREKTAGKIGLGARAVRQLFELLMKLSRMAQREKQREK